MDDVLEINQMINDKQGGYEFYLKIMTVMVLK